jgi:hypothetical protein
MTKPQDDPQPSRRPATAPARAQPTPPCAAPAQATWKRRDSGVLDQSLQSFTEMWLKGIPENVRPLNCAEHYPRVLNKIAALWSLNERCMDYLNELVIDVRGGRQGFSYGVLGELRRLRTHRVALMSAAPPPEPPDANGHTDFMSTVPMPPDSWPPRR